MAVSGLFLVSYGVFRFFIEFYRVPDAHLNYLLLMRLSLFIMTLNKYLVAKKDKKEKQNVENKDNISFTCD